MEETLDLIYKDPKYPSSKVVNGLSMAGPRAHLRGMGLDNEDLSKPFIGVINTYSEMHPGHVHLDRLGKLVRDGVLEAGGIPFEVNTISICDGFSQGHVGMCSVLPSREIIADSIDVYAAGHQLDGLVLIGGCDKVVPAMLMAALRVNLPTVIVTGGPMMPAVYKGRTYATYELKEMAGKLTRGELSRQEYEYMEGLMSPTPGSCAMMGTANTMSVVAEALGLTLPGSACAHAVSGKKNRVVKLSGKAVVRLVEKNIRPRDIVTQKMLELAVRVGLSVGGSTNMTLHMPAIAHEAGLSMTLEDIGRLSADTPYLAKIKPSGTHTMLDLDQAGGVGAVMRELDGLIDLDQMTVNGRTHRQNVADVVEYNPEVIHPVEQAYSDHGSITVLKGNLAPDGAVVKQSAVAAQMRKHSGPAHCFECEEDAVKAIYGGGIQHGEVIVIRNEGPQGGPGMREMLTATAALVGMGFAESVALVTDERFSGATRGPCICAALQLTGLISAMACGGKQAAISHSLYSYFCTCRPEIRSRFLHGELVGGQPGLPASRQRRPPGRAGGAGPIPAAVCTARLSGGAGPGRQPGGAGQSLCLPGGTYACYRAPGAGAATDPGPAALPRSELTQTHLHQ